MKVLKGKKARLSPRILEEEGAVMAVTAVMLTVLMYFILAYAIDSARIKAAASDLRAKTDMMCKALAYEPMRQTKVTDLLDLHFDSFSNLIYGAVPQSARVDFPVFGSTEGQSGFHYLSCEPSSSDNPNCLLVNPPALVSTSPMDVGNYLSCTVRAEVRGVLPGVGWLFDQNRIIEAVSAWSRPVRSSSSYSRADNIHDLLPHEKPALTLAIATQMTTRASDSRFRFSSSDLDPYNPLPAGASGDLFSTVPLPHAYVPQVPYIPQNMSQPAAITKAEDLEEMLVACMNPAVLVRNTFNSMIVELASRHGHLRNNTEIISINSKDKSPNTQFPYVAPALITNFGQDLALRDYQHPYVFYPAGTTTTLPQVMQQQPKSWDEASSELRALSLINPFPQTETNTPHPFYDFSDQTHGRLMEHHALIAGQLRYCNALYAIPDVGNPRLERFALGGLEEPGPFLPSEDGYILPGSLPWLPVNTENIFWDLEEPWGTAERLTAGEVVSSLGTTQSCPYEESDLPVEVFWEIYHEGHGEYEAGTCHKIWLPPQGEEVGDFVGSFDVEPDFRSLFTFLAETSPSNGAIVSPGIAPLDMNGEELKDSAGAHPFSESNYRYYLSTLERKNPDSHILLVMHQPVSGADTDGISELIEGLNTGRPVTIVYIPTNRRDASVVAVDTLREAFNAETNFDEFSDINTNRLYVFSPYEEIHDSGGDSCVSPEGFCSDGYLTESEVFREYWEYLLEPSHKYSIRSRAKKIFLERILSERLVL